MRKGSVLFECPECGHTQPARSYEKVFCRRFSAHKRWRMVRMRLQR